MFVAGGVTSDQDFVGNHYADRLAARAALERLQTLYQNHRPAGSEV